MVNHGDNQAGHDQRTEDTPSPSDSVPYRHKRKRKSLSCYQCRRRKVKCDRTYPSCIRCQRGGQASSCTYEALPPQSTPTATISAALESISTNPTTRNAVWNPSLGATAHSHQTPHVGDKLLDLEAAQPLGTLQILGEVAAVHNKHSDRLIVGADSFFSSPRDTQPTETMIFRGQNFKTQYYGATNPISLIAQFPELRTFMKDTITHGTSLPQVQREIKALQAKWKAEKTSTFPLTDVDLLELLPDRETVDQLAKFYFDTFECTYRIMHGPSFWKEYQTFWQNQSAASPSFVVILLLLLATVQCVSPKESTTYVGDSSIAREFAALWIQASELWLDHQSRKHVYLGIWQVRCLLQLAKQLNTVKKKRTWTSAGTLVREAMSAGFHRDASMLGTKMAVFEQEMRRRLWATMTEMELQASIDRGMASASAGIVSDSANVLNINDDELISDSESAPTSRKSWSHATASSFLHISNDSFTLRVTLTSILNNPSSELRYEDVLDYEQKITHHIEKIPPWDTVQATQMSSSAFHLTKTLLELQLRQFLILLHGPFARQADTNSRYSLSKMICFNNAAIMIKLHSQLVSAGQSMLLLLRHDVFRAALSICHNYHVSNAIKNDLFLLNLDRKNVIQHIDTALLMLDNKITRLGTGYTHYWYISAALALVRSSMSQETQVLEQQQAVERVSKQYDKVLASQEDFAKAKEILLPKRAYKPTMPNGTFDTIPPTSDDAINSMDLPFVVGNIPQIAFPEPDLQLNEYYFGDPAAWTFDNLWEFDT